MVTRRKIQDDFSIRQGAQRHDQDGKALCMASGCEAHADYPAPRNKQDLRNYIKFCLEHIRCFNQSWNYYDGIEGDELEAEIRRATTWERPTWKFGTGKSAYQFDDRFHFFENAEPSNAKDSTSALDPEEAKAWALFDLPANSDMQELKKRYNELAKKYHPDHNQGDSHAEELLKEINLAYSVLRKKVLDLNSPAA